MIHALPTSAFEVSHPTGGKIRHINCDSRCCRTQAVYTEFVETALGDSPSPIQLVVAQDCLQHFAEAPIEDGRNTSFNSVRMTYPYPNHFFG